ncbi:serine hydrolase domain-containing protein [Quisquiliibacterium transsilvanicum]|uniref:CubicO group peptidase (Beta-lactamase class C family) n=1 Tax=Quisquiliibacterium transsilvanicum TaxID=1549638 RepID=A0A7W8HHH9_9BURK|nr:serine hydrolase domain-containing protein [Quisquiliibacterium transsilvanicum]MBB5272013.1 CubicO group peptidase (beta-lactamase class C family) [Quisquiliibacterium transsilvanicum]
MKTSIELMLDYQLAARHYPGAVIHVEQDGRVLAHAVAGRLRGEGDAPMREDALFRIASLSKAVVSVLTLMLVDEGLVGLDTPAQEYLPPLAKQRMPDGALPSRPVTVRDLLRHTAGVPYAGELRDPALRANAQASGLDGRMASMTPAEFLDALVTLPLANQPGAAFRYGFATDLAGLVVERVTGQRLGEALRERLLDPLGMVDTGFVVADADLGRLAGAHSSDKAWHGFDRMFRDGQAKGSPMHSGGGGLVSTVADYAAFARMLAGGGELGGRRFLKPETFAQMASDQLGAQVDGPAGYAGPGFGFGLALAVRHDWGAAAVPSPAGELTWSGVTGTGLYVRPADRWFAIKFSCNNASRLMARFEFRRAAGML